MTKERKSEMACNAKNAFIELAAMVGVGGKDAPATTKAADTNPPASTSQKSATPSAAPQPTPSAVSPLPKAIEKTVISEGTFIDGTIRTEGSIECSGTVKGDIIAKGTVSIAGEHTGNIQGGQITFSHASIEGNVSAQGEVSVDNATKIVGDIKTGSMILDGKVTGSIFAEDLVVFQKDAVLSGNVQAARISMLEGARISGEVKMTLPE